MKRIKLPAIIITSVAIVASAGYFVYAQTSIDNKPDSQAIINGIPQASVEPSPSDSPTVDSTPEPSPSSDPVTPAAKAQPQAIVSAPQETAPSEQPEVTQSVVEDNPARQPVSGTGVTGLKQSPSQGPDATPTVKVNN